jgi:DNA-binding winged helix-turn-helix (wHTH) protein
MRVRFGEFQLDSDTREVRRGGEPIHLPPKAFVLLELLVRSRPRALSRGEIRRRLWPDTHAGDANLNVLVGELRQALGEDAREPALIRTVFGFGYAFAGEAEEEGRPNGATAASQPRILWERRMIPLLEGENVIGRDEGVAIRIDAPGVSRRHARVLVHRDQATLEDLGSKNGTWLEDERLTVPTPLPDGAAFRLGRLVLVFRSGPETGSTVTERGGETPPPGRS